MQKFTMKCKHREVLGKNKVKHLRTNGLVPAVVYGHGENTVSVSLEKESMVNLLKKLHGEPAILELEFEDKNTALAIIKHFQKDIMSNALLHVDLQIIHPGEPLKISVPVVTIGTPEGVKAGGMIDNHLKEIDVEAIPSKLPEHIEIDVSKLEIGQGIHIKEIDFEEVTCHNDPNQLVVSVISPKAAHIGEEAGLEEEGLLGEEVEGETESASDET